MPELDLSELNIVIAVLGAFTVLYGFCSVKIKQVWYLGEALPAMMIGIALGPLAAKFLDVDRWGAGAPEQEFPVSLGICRIVIGVQLVIAGFQLPAKYQLLKWLEMTVCLLPVMTIMWLCTTACIMLTIPNLSLLAALVIGSCVTCTDPILSQAVAKGPFSDKYVPRYLREIISSEAGANDGFGFPFLLLAVYLMRHADLTKVVFKTPELRELALNAANGVHNATAAAGAALEGAGNATTGGAAQHLAERAFSLLARSEGETVAEELTRLGGGVGEAMKVWLLEGWLYIIIMSVVIGAVLGYGSCVAIKFALKRRWIDGESFLLWPTALGLFTVGVCGLLGTDDLLACFAAGNALNWNGLYLEESEKRHDEVNSCVDVLLNFGGFMYIGTILPWNEFHMPEVTGITLTRLILLGILIMFFRRLPAIFITYKFMPKVCKTWKEALFMGWFGPIGIGAVFYVEHTRTLYPKSGLALTLEEDRMVAAMIPVVYWLVFFSIIFHGLSIPALNAFYVWRGVPPIVNDMDGPVELVMLSENEALPNNAYVNHKRGSIVVLNRFSRPDLDGRGMREFEELDDLHRR